MIKKYNRKTGLYNKKNQNNKIHNNRFSNKKNGKRKHLIKWGLHSKNPRIRRRFRKLLGIKKSIYAFSVRKFLFRKNKKFKLTAQRSLMRKLVKKILKRQLRKKKLTKAYKFLLKKRNNPKFPRTYYSYPFFYKSDLITDSTNPMNEVLALIGKRKTKQEAKFIKLYKLLKTRAILTKFLGYRKNLTKFLTRLVNRRKRPLPRYWLKFKPIFATKAKLVKLYKLNKKKLLKLKNKKSSKSQKDSKNIIDDKVKAHRELLKKMLLKIYQPEVSSAVKRHKRKISLRNRPLKTLFVNALNSKGKKSKSSKILLNSVLLFKSKYRGKNIKQVLKKIVHRVRTSIAFRNKKLGSMNYKVPIPISKTRSVAFGVRTLVKYSGLNSRNLKVSESLFSEMENSLLRKSSSFKKRVEIHKLGLDSRPYLHYYKAKKRN